jgi:hypothetical protein
MGKRRKKSFINHDTTCKRLRATGLDDIITLQIVDLINHWKKESGSSWVISRLKSLKTAYFHKLAGKEDIWKDSPWIAHHKDGSPKGPFRQIFNLKKPQKAISALMVYSQVKADRATKQQLKKFFDAVLFSIPEGESDKERKDIARNRMMFKSRIHNSTISLIETMQPNSGYLKRHAVKCPSPVLTSRKKVRIPILTLESVRDMRFSVRSADNLSASDHFVGSFTHPFFMEWYDDFVKNEVSRGIPLDPSLENTVIRAIQQGEYFDRETSSFAGRIGFIQEPGLKLRTIANPFPSFQVALTSMGDNLLTILRDFVDEDCTFDQTKGIKEIQSYMLSHPGDELMSIDLSSATDRFPLFLQETVLDTLKAYGYINQRDINLFTRLARSKWAVPSNPMNISDVTWKTGQPLGLYPSFALFALTHHMLVRNANPSFYRILGDDIVIDAQAGERLRELYKNIHLVISEDKSIRSNKLAEFGGRLITPDRIYVQPKWKEINDRSFIELARNLGPTSVSMFSDKQQRVLRVLAKVHPHVHPWGLDWNSSGIPYQTRIERSKQIMSKFFKEDLVTVSRNQIEFSRLRYELDMDAHFPMEFDPRKFSGKLPDYLRYPERVPNQDITKETDSTPVKPTGQPQLVVVSEESFSLNRFFYRSDSLLEAIEKRIDIMDVPENEIPSGFNVVIESPKGDPRGPTALQVARKKIDFSFGR